MTRAITAFIAAALLAAPPPARADEANTARVTGTVRDAEGGAPLSGVSVYLVETGEVAVTDDEGRFELAGVARGTWHLAVVDPSHRRGDATVVVGDGDPEPIEVSLVPVSLRGDEVVVESERRRPAVGSASLDREEVTRVPGARGDVLTAVKSLPGVANSPLLGGGLMIRGSAPADSRIYVDGFEVPILYHFGGVQSVIPSEMIDGLAYSPGGYGVEYGSASGGIIEVDSRPGDREFGGFTEISFINAAAFAKGPIGEEASFAVAVRRSLVDSVIPLVVPDDGSLDFTALPRYYDYQARTDWRPAPNWRLSLFALGTDDLVELESGEENAADPMATGFRMDTSFHRAIASATYDGPRVFNRFAIAGGLMQEGLAFSADRFIDVDVASLAARNEGRVQLGEKVKLLLGGEAEVSGVDVRVKAPRPPREGDPGDPNLTYDPIIDVTQRATATDLGGWAAVRVEPIEELEATAGVRVDAFTRSGAVVAQPRLHARAQLAPKLAVLGSAGLYTRPPDDQDENFQTDLDPERALQTSLGVEQALLEGLTLQLTGYYVDRDDLIVFAGDRMSVPEGDAEGTYDNAGTGRSFGGELLLRMRRARFFGWLAYTLARSEQVDHPGEEARLFDFDQTHNLVAVGSVELGAGGRWRIGGRFQYTSGAPYTPVVDAVFVSDQNRYRPEYGPVNSARAEAQHQFDLRVDRRFELEDWELSAFLDVSNVYMNTPVLDYEYNYDYTEREEVRGLPITPAIGVRGEF